MILSPRTEGSGTRRQAAIRERKTAFSSGPPAMIVSNGTIVAPRASRDHASRVEGSRLARRAETRVGRDEVRSGEHRTTRKYHRKERETRRSQLDHELASWYGSSLNRLLRRET